MSLLAGEAKVPTDYSSKELKLSYETEGEGLFFNLPVMDDDFEITGPIAAKLWISSDSIDADLFLVLRLYDLDGNEVKFIGTNDPAVPVGMGWLRASHRKLDTERSLFYRPYHSHDEKWPLEPGKPVEVDIEIWPTCIVVPSGYRLSLNIRGCDYKGPDAALPNAPYPMTGVGPFTHTSEKDRPKEIFGGKNELHFGKEKRSYLLLPVIP
jgi:predicted acyl esterase